MRIYLIFSRLYNIVVYSANKWSVPLTRNDGRAQVCLHLHGLRRQVSLIRTCRCHVHTGASVQLGAFTAGQLRSRTRKTAVPPAWAPDSVRWPAVAFFPPRVTPCGSQSVLRGLCPWARLGSTGRLVLTGECRR